MGRTLVYVPVIHTAPELGSLSEKIQETSHRFLGEERWKKHKEVVSQFWSRIEKFLKRKDVTGWKIFQDGLAAEGDLGKRIVKDAAGKGSRNHKLILELMDRGASLVKTEDPALLKEEYRLIKDLSSGKFFLSRILAYLEYKFRKGKFLQKRDQFIAQRINESLKEGEVGLCFLGGYHDIEPYLEEDVNLTKLKDPAKVKAYYQELSLRRRNQDVLWRLGLYLTNPIKLQINNNANKNED